MSYKESVEKLLEENDEGTIQEGGEAELFSFFNTDSRY